jgi:hypothetical protein
MPFCIELQYRELSAMHADLASEHQQYTSLSSSLTIEDALYSDLENELSDYVALLAYARYVRAKEIFDFMQISVSHTSSKEDCKGSYDVY